MDGVPLGLEHVPETMAFDHPADESATLFEAIDVLALHLEFWKLRAESEQAPGLTQ